MCMPCVVRCRVLCYITVTVTVIGSAKQLSNPQGSQRLMGDQGRNQAPPKQRQKRILQYINFSVIVAEGRPDGTGSMPQPLYSSSPASLQHNLFLCRMPCAVGHCVLRRTYFSL